MFPSCKCVVLIFQCFILNCLDLGVHSAVQLEQYFRCKQSDPKFNDCMMNVLNEVQPIVAHGLPELGIEPLDPLLIPRMAMDNLEGVKFKQVLTDIVVKGIKNAKLKKADFSKLPHSMDMSWEIPDFQVSNNYSIEGLIMGIPLKGKGQSWFNCTALRTSIRIKCDLVKMNGVDHLQVTDMQYSLEAPKTAKLKFTNSLSKDKKLTEATSRFFNDNWRSIFDMFKNVRTGTVEAMMRESFNKLLAAYPYDVVFPK